MSLELDLTAPFLLVEKKGRKGKEQYFLQINSPISQADAQAIERMNQEVERRKREVDPNIISTSHGSFDSYVTASGKVSIELIDGNESERRKY